ncbi:hypothetical protein SCOR_01955 [Sulfidibacter corallicola]
MKKCILVLGLGLTLIGAPVMALRCPPFWPAPICMGLEPVWEWCNYPDDMSYRIECRLNIEFDYDDCNPSRC